MTYILYAVAVLLPFLGAANKYSISYGYAGKSRDEAKQDAFYAGLGVAIFVSLPTLIVLFLTGGPRL